ncbi:MAG: cupin domain-containing protein [Pseudomonadota bacterium]
MKIVSADAMPTVAADPAHFTGAVWQRPVLRTPEGPEVALLRVHFAPGGRTHWHTHPAGQTLHVLSGIGIIQKRGQAAEPIRPGDTVWIPAGVEHWHGAAPGHAMEHLAMQAVIEGTTALWLDAVTEDVYAASEAVLG